LGPYVGVFLLTQAGCNQATIGAVLTVSGLIGITLHTPIGALIDATHFKRGLIIAGTGALAMCALAIAWAPTLPIIGPAEFSLWAIVQARSLSSASVGRFPRLQYPLSRATSQGLWQKRASNAALPPGPFRVVLAQYGPLRSGLRKPRRGFLARLQAMGAAEMRRTRQPNNST
jgi:hypothetical protein